MIPFLLLIHMAYPPECCHNQQHCRPIPCDSIEETSRGNVHDHLLYPANRTYPSLDGQCHACSGPVPPYNTPAPFCLFIIPTM